MLNIWSFKTKQFVFAIFLVSAGKGESQDIINPLEESLESYWNEVKARESIADVSRESEEEHQRRVDQDHNDQGKQGGGTGWQSLAITRCSSA